MADAGSDDGGRRAARAGWLARLPLAGFGAGAGLAGWLLLDALTPVLGGGRLHLGLGIFAAVFFAAALALAGPLRHGPALAFAAADALVATGLALLAGGRFDEVNDLAGSQGFLPALILVAAIPVPFRLAAAGGGWREPGALFHAGWSLCLRWAGGLAFAGLVWLVIALCDTLLRLVGLELLSALMRAVAPLPWMLTGGLLGLGLSVMHETGARGPVALVARLLRLMLPPVTLVVALFLALVPMRGIDAVFLHMSAAATMLAIAFGAVALLSLVAGSRGTAGPGRIERLAARALALMLVPLAALAAWSLALRVIDYGLTPGRVVALYVVVAAVGLAVGYGIAALRRRGDWLAGIGRANLAMAVVVWLLAALALTPAGDPYRLSVASQLARHADGRLGVAALPLREMNLHWGRAGQRALGQLRAAAATDPALAVRLAALVAPLDADAPAPETRPDAAALRALIAVRPDGRTIPDWVDPSVTPGLAEQVAQGCRRRDDAGRPGCVLVLGDFRPERPGEEAMLFLNLGGELGRQDYAESGEGPVRTTRLGATPDPGAVLARLHDGQFRLGRVEREMLDIGSTLYLMQP